MRGVNSYKVAEKLKALKSKLKDGIIMFLRGMELRKGKPFKIWPFGMTFGPKDASTKPSLKES